MLPMCRALEDRRIKNLMIILGPGGGKSNLISVIYPAWRLGVDAASTILGISAGENLVQGFLHGVMEIVEYSPHYHRFFPNTRPDKSAGWSTERGIFVTGHQLGDADASYWGAGLDSKSLGGKHAREIILDDLHDDTNSATSEQCLKVRKRYYNTLLGRADPRGARRILAGRRWSEQDLYGHFSDSGDWVVMTLPNERAGETALYIDVRVPKGLECCFTDTMLPEPIQPREASYVVYKAYYGADPTAQGFYWPSMPEKRLEYFTTKRNEPAVAESVYQCNPGARQGAVFRRDDFVYFAPPPRLAEGMRRQEVAEWVTEKGGFLAQVWDTAAGKSQGSAYTVGITLLLVPSRDWHRGEDTEYFGEAEHHYLVYVMDVLRRKMDFGQLAGAVREKWRTWRPRIVLVEDKFSGISLLQTMRGSGINVKGVKTSEGKVERAIDAVGGASGSVQGWSRQGRILFPAEEKTWLDGFEQELIDFSTDSGGRKDQVDAFVHGVVYAIQQGAKSITLPTDDPMEISDEPRVAVDPRAVLFQSFATLDEYVTDPFADRCGGDHPCYFWKVQSPNGRGSWCRFHQRVVSALDSCEHRRDPAEMVQEEPIYG
jgi:predicted phage terminase large subunit-like protein